MANNLDYVALPQSLAAGAVRISTHRTEIVENGAGAEARNSRWRGVRRRYVLAAQPRPLAELTQLQDFFNERGGRLGGFLWDDVLDNSATDEPLRVLDDTRQRFGLQKFYGERQRDIIAPKPASVRLTRNGSLLTPARDYQLQAEGGEIIFNTPQSSRVRFVASFNFWTAVRFDTDQLEITRLSDKAGRAAPLPLVELPLTHNIGA